MIYLVSISSPDTMIIFEVEKVVGSSCTSTYLEHAHSLSNEEFHLRRRPSYQRVHCHNNVMLIPS
jgi:hypothetical protein